MRKVNTKGIAFMLDAVGDVCSIVCVIIELGKLLKQYKQEKSNRRSSQE